MKTFSRLLCLCSVLTLLISSGCLKDPNATTEKPPEKPREGIIGKTTQDIGEFDPEGGSVEVDLHVDPNSSPLGAATGAYKYAAAQTQILTVRHAMQLYNAEFDRYPKDHAEFMEGIVKRNNMQLPVLPGKARYEYDVENHELKIVEGHKGDNAENSSE